MLHKHVTSNPYEPPKAELTDITGNEKSPPLWNPNAAANWSLLFSPAFGAFLHMKNWQSLGDSDKAASAKLWFVFSLVALGGLAGASVIVPSSKPVAGLFRPIGIVLLFCWYFGSARGQAAYVKEHFANVYPRRGWLKPLSLALAALFGFLVFFTIVATALKRAA